MISLLLLALAVGLYWFAEKNSDKNEEDYLMFNGKGAFLFILAILCLAASSVVAIINVLITI